MSAYFASPKCNRQNDKAKISYFCSCSLVQDHWQYLTKLCMIQSQVTAIAISFQLAHVNTLIIYIIHNRFTAVFQAYQSQQCLQCKQRQSNEGKSALGYINS